MMMTMLKITSSLVGSAKPGKWTRGGSPTKASPPLTRIIKPFINDDHLDDNDDDDDDLGDNYNNDDDVDDNYDNGGDYDANDAYIYIQDYLDSCNDDITADYIDDKYQNDCYNDENCDGDEDNKGDDDISIYLGNKQRGFRRCCSAWESEQP